MKRLRELLPALHAPGRRSPDRPRASFAAAPYVVGRDDRGRIIYSSSPTLPRRL